MRGGSDLPAREFEHSAPGGSLLGASPWRVPTNLLDHPVPLQVADVPIANRMAAFLRRELDLAEPIGAERFPGGRANLTYLLTDAIGREVVVRRPPFGAIPKGAHDMEREFRVMSTLAEKLHFVPATYVLCTDPDVLEVSFFAMERVRGLVLRDEWPDGLADDWVLRADMTKSFLSAIAELHQLDAAEVGLESFGRPEGFMGRQLDGWQRRWKAATDRRDHQVDDLFDWLRVQEIPPQPPALIHNDLKLDNAMFSGEDATRLVAIFDWDMATRGDPLADIGTLLVYWAEGDDDLNRHGGYRLPTAYPGFYSRGELVESYANLTGRDVSAIRYYEVFGLVKVAVIMEQLLRRYREGNATDDRVAIYETQAPTLWRDATRLARGS